eukprot:evm.model.NODE_42098_length_28510_cov_28.859102.8
MSDVAARRRAKILAQGGDRMKLVSGFGAAIAQRQPNLNLDKKSSSEKKSYTSGT